MAAFGKLERESGLRLVIKIAEARWVRRGDKRDVLWLEDPEFSILNDAVGGTCGSREYITGFIDIGCFLFFS